MGIGHFLKFASEAAIAGLWGLAFIALSIVALWGAARRMKRARIDGVGWMPWRTLFLVGVIVGGGLLILAAKGLLAG